MIPRPAADEAAEFYFTYINQVPDGDIRDVLQEQLRQAVGELEPIADARSTYRYAPDKWSIREVLAHLNDTERLFTFRALWFARGLDSPLPSFDQDAAVRAAGAHDRSWHSLIHEFQDVRHATVSLFQSLPPDAWSRRGIASQKSISVRALAFVVAGHVNHHLKILRERYA